MICGKQPFSLVVTCELEFLALFNTSTSAVIHPASHLMVLRVHCNQVTGRAREPLVLVSPVVISHATPLLILIAALLGSYDYPYSVKRW